MAFYNSLFTIHQSHIRECAYLNLFELLFVTFKQYYNVYSGFTINFYNRAFFYGHPVYL